MPAAPKSLTIRSYNVGFGDCYLLSFKYARNERHILMDFGSTSLPKGAKKTHMMDIASDIKARTNGKLDAVVATHRHKDHISGFDITAGAKSTGDVIKKLKPSRVVQPWTEDPELGTKATGPKLKKFGKGTPAHIAGLHAMNEFAGWIHAATFPRFFSKALREELSFLGENNILNKSAVKNLMAMGPNSYVHCGSKSGLEGLLPGVKIDVLGPPTVDQTDTIKKQRSEDANEFWHLAAKMARVTRENDDKPAAPFKRHVKSTGTGGTPFPVDSRWFIYRARNQRTEQLLQIVRMLDKAMNNTSVILLFRVGSKHILFPGDAQLENWQYALSQPKYQKLLEKTDLYKVGHHGSLNATPKSLWKLFKKRRKTAGSGRLQTLMSTMEGKHGHEHSNTEVPRRTLTNALKSESDHFTTQSLKDGLFKDFTLTF
jgi:hypothetical protein